MYAEDVWDIAVEVFLFVLGVVVCIGGVWLLIWAVAGLVNHVENAPPWCHVVTTTGEIETQDCPSGFNSGDRIYWDNEKKTYAKVG